MLKRTFGTLLVSTALSMVAPSIAMAADAAAQATGASDATNGEIIVTARRTKENLQDIPVSVQVVSGDTLKKLSITQLTDISKLAAGLSIVDNGGASDSVTLRGVTWQPGSGTPATPIYLNEIPFDPGESIRAMFDVEQIEVLRGPQGTTRGAPSISGAVTMTTKRPDLENYGGYVQSSYGEGNHWDIQGAVSVPLIKDKLAIRAAVNLENSDGNRVFSVNSAIKPHYDNRTYRLTALFTPTDTLSILGMYQHRTDTSRGYGQVVGNGSPGAVGGVNPLNGVVSATIPANFNGPPITLAQRASVSDMPSVNNDDVDIYLVNAKWKVLGQELSYNYGRLVSHSHENYEAQDGANFLPGFEPFLSFVNVGTPLFQTQEVRLSSERHPGRFFDYDLGFYQKKTDGVLDTRAPAYFAGAFGEDGTYGGVNGSPNPAYVLNSDTKIAIGQQYDSFYGNVVLHLPYNTELSGGIRQIRDRVPVNLNVNLSNAFGNVNNIYLNGNCPATINHLPASGSQSYPGTCDYFLPGAFIAPAPENFDPVYHNRIYNLSLSHKFASNILAYATTGTSYRSGLPAINNPGLPGTLEIPKPENATSYEVGLKTSWGRRLTIDADIFQIDYKNQLTTFQGVNYYNSTSGRTSQTSIAFYDNINTRIRGIEADISARPTDQLSLSANVSYTPIESRGGQVPCNQGAAINAGNPINFCASPSGQNLNQTSPFQATVSGSYTAPLSERFDGYLRFNVKFLGENPNFGNFPDANGNFKSTPAYALVDLYAGLTGKAGIWDLGLYVKNAFDNSTELNRTAMLNNIYSPYAAAQVGYAFVGTVAPREIGVTLRYAFGSR